MPFNLLIKRQAKKILQSPSRTDRNRMTEKIVMLGANPDNPLLDIKALQGTHFFRLRIGNWRVIFDRDNQLKIIAIEKIKPRGDIYK